MKHLHYKVRATDDAPLMAIQNFLEAERACVVATSRRFNYVAADDLSDDLRRRLDAMGARVEEDICYDRD